MLLKSVVSYPPNVVALQLLLCSSVVLGQTVSISDELALQIDVEEEAKYDEVGWLNVCLVCKQPGTLLEDFWCQVARKAADSETNVQESVSITPRELSKHTSCRGLTLAEGSKVPLTFKHSSRPGTVRFEDSDLERRKLVVSLEVFATTKSSNGTRVSVKKIFEIPTTLLVPTETALKERVAKFQKRLESQHDNSALLKEFCEDGNWKEYLSLLPWESQQRLLKASLAQSQSPPHFRREIIALAIGKSTLETTEAISRAVAANNKILFDPYVQQACVELNMKSLLQQLFVESRDYSLRWALLRQTGKSWSHPKLGELVSEMALKGEYLDKPESVSADYFSVVSILGDLRLVPSIAPHLDDKRKLRGDLASSVDNFQSDYRLPQVRVCDSAHDAILRLIGGDLNSRAADAYSRLGLRYSYRNPAFWGGVDGDQDFLPDSRQTTVAVRDFLIARLQKQLSPD